MKVIATENHKRKSGGQPATESCRKLALAADNPEEKRLLAMLNCILTDTLCLKHSGNTVRLYKYLQTQLPEQITFP